MENTNGPEPQSDLRAIARDQYLPEAEKVTPANEEKINNYLGELKKYFISGKKTGESLRTEVYPIRFGLLKNEAEPISGYPVFYDSENGNLTSLYHLLDRLVAEHFEMEVAKIIQNELPKLFGTVQKTIQENAFGIVAQPFIEEIISALQTLDLPKKDTAAFEGTIDKIREKLLSQVKILFGFSGRTAFQILNLQHKLRDNLKLEFLSRLKNVINGLNELLILHAGTSKLSDVQMDFAEDLISFDKIKDLAVPSVSSQFPKSSISRLKSALQTLTTAQKLYAQGTMTIIASEQVIKAFDLERIFDGLTIKVASNNPSHDANIQSRKSTDRFIETIAALRMGQLMIDQKYDEALHDDYFDQFDLTHLTEDDLRYLHPTLVIEDSRQLMLHSHDFISLLSKNSFVKVLGINLLGDLFDSNNQEKSDYLELAALAISRRTNYVFQGSIDLPSSLMTSYQKGLELPGAVFWNILIPPKEIKNDHATFLSLQAAIESRCFPRVEYTTDGNALLGNQIDLKHNPSPDTYLVTYKQKIKTQTGIESKALGFTMADFLAIDSKLKGTIEILPSVYQNSHFIPLHEYLALPPDTLAGKIPFIWCIDDQNKLKQAAIPVYWVQACRSRLEYWNFLQSISGINKVQLQNTLEAAKLKWEESKNKEIEALTSALQEQFKKQRSHDLRIAITRILHNLLNQGKRIETVLTEVSNEEVKTTFDPEGSPKPVQAPREVEQVEEKKEDTKTIIKEEAWVESEECTSCKDCIDALPSVFKYNEDKQAYVHNPKGGTFAQIVKAAERCPAMCIHPGVPQNKNEASLDKWIKRAEKFN